MALQLQMGRGEETRHAAFDARKEAVEEGRAPPPMPEPAVTRLQVSLPAPLPTIPLPTDDLLGAAGGGAAWRGSGAAR